MEYTRIEFILLLAIVVVIFLDRFFNNTLRNSSYGEGKFLIGIQKTKKIKIKAFIYITTTILFIIAFFVPKSFNLDLIKFTRFSSIEILFWFLLHLLVIYYCYSLIRDEFILKKVIAKEILFFFILITTSIVAYLGTTFLSENYEIILGESAVEKVSMKRISLRGNPKYYKLAEALPKCALLDDINNPIILKYENARFNNYYGKINRAANYNILNVNNTASACDYFRYTFNYYNKYTFGWGNHPYNQLFSFFWEINLSKSIKESITGIILYVGILFRGLLFFLYGIFRINKWAINTLKD